MLIFSSLWLILVYAPICHWVWGGGWLGEMGLQDFAGGAVVHITAGVAALVAATSLGGRRGFGQTAMPPHNLTMTVTGAGMLWVGWFGFNAGSAVAADSSAARRLACFERAWFERLVREGAVQRDQVHQQASLAACNLTVGALRGSRAHYAPDFAAYFSYHRFHSGVRPQLAANMTGALANATPFV